MTIRYFLPAAAVATVLALAAGASAQRGGLDVTGEWTAQVGTHSCKITLTDKDWFGAFQASSFGCPGRLMTVGKWRVEGSEIVLIGAGDQVAARLRSRGRALAGADSGGQALTLSRAGSPPRLPGGPARGDRPGGGGTWNRDCVRYGDSDRCADREDMRPPQLRILTTANVRSGPGYDAQALTTVPKGSCVSLQECRQERGDLWCRIEWEGGRGYVVQVARNAGDPSARILIFKNGCGGE